MAQQDKNISVGNTKSNARGDQLGRGGRVVKSADEIANEHYNKNNPKTQKEESAALAKKFAGMVIITNTRNDTSHAKARTSDVRCS